MSPIIPSPPPPKPPPEEPRRSSTSSLRPPGVQSIAHPTINLAQNPMPPHPTAQSVTLCKKSHQNHTPSELPSCRLRPRLSFAPRTRRCLQRSVLPSPLPPSSWLYTSSPTCGRRTLATATFATSFITSSVDATLHGATSITAP